MAETALHRELIHNMYHWVSRNYPEYKIIIDLPLRPGDDVPPQIGKHRPDLLAEDKKGCSAIIGEAKNGKYLSRRHTKVQIFDFLEWLSHKDFGMFVLSIPHAFLDEGFYLLWLLWRESGYNKLTISLITEYECWLSMFKNGDNKWHLH